jgi:DNA-directed RNA polymerase specialized sigma24 family protein
MMKDEVGFASAPNACASQPFFRAPLAAAAPSPRSGGGVAAVSDGEDRDAWAKLLSFLPRTHGDGPGSAYERAHKRLVRFFRARGATHAEELADATFDRVARKLRSETLAVHNPSGYLLGMARRIWLEQVKLEVSQRHRLGHYQATHMHDDHDDTRARERHGAILDRCLGELAPEQRSLLMSYYQGRGQVRITGRQDLVRSLGMNPGMLRTRVHRLRARLSRRAHELLAVEQPAS